MKLTQPVREQPHNLVSFMSFCYANANPRLLQHCKLLSHKCEKLNISLFSL